MGAPKKSRAAGHLWLLCMAVVLLLGGAVPISTAQAAPTECQQAANKWDAIYSGQRVEPGITPVCKLPAGLVRSIQAQETCRLAPTAVSSANAIGCMQTLPEYHQNPNYKSRLSGSISLTNPDQNTERGAEYLCYLASLKPGDWTYVVHAYNAGEAGALSASLPAETRAYCSGVKAYLSVLSPPLENQLQCKASTLKRECIDETNINFDQSVALLTKLTAQFLQCWSCDLLEALTVGGILTGEKVYDKLRSALIALILAVQGLFALWYVFKVMQPFGADGRVSGVFNEYASNLFVAFFICLVLASSGFFWKYLYIPVLSGAMDLSGTIVSAANNPQLNSCAPVAGGDLPNVAKSLGARLSCQVRGVSEGVGSGVTIGWAMWNRMTLIAEGTRIDLKA